MEKGETAIAFFGKVEIKGIHTAAGVGKVASVKYLTGALKGHSAQIVVSELKKEEEE